MNRTSLIFKSNLNRHYNLSRFEIEFYGSDEKEILHSTKAFLTRGYSSQLHFNLSRSKLFLSNLKSNFLFTIYFISRMNCIENGFRVELRVSMGLVNILLSYSKSTYQLKIWNEILIFALTLQKISLR